MCTHLEGAGAMADKLDPSLPKIALLLRVVLGNGATDSERISAIHAVRRRLEGADSDSHELVDRIENRPLSPSEMQKIHDAAYSIGHADGVEQGRRSAVMAAAQPTSIVATGNVGSGVNGYSWFDIARYCACNKHRIARDKDGKFVESIAEQLT